ncbi:MAG: hypothetical protein QM651_09760 [Rhodoblastus sp.]
MLEKNARQFFDLAQHIDAIAWLIDSRIQGDTTGATAHRPVEDQPLKGTIAVKLDEAAAICDDLELDAALASIERLRERVEGRQYPPTYDELRDSIADISSRMSDQLRARNFLFLSSAEAYFYTPRAPLFGPEFEEKFRSHGVFELDEAAKCLALSRSTAAVFHLMRLLEIGIHAISSCLAIPDPVSPAARNWGAILKAIRAGIDQKWPTQADKLSPDYALFDALHASLDAAKHPWRNATMHVENKYTHDEASHILMAVKGFMTKLASRCDEQGNPKA